VTLPALVVALGLPALVALTSAACGPKDRTGLPDAVPGATPAAPVVVSQEAGAADATTDGVAPQPDAGDAASDAATATDADAGACLPGATLSMDAAFAGALAVRGTLTLPAPLPAGRTLVLSVGLASGSDTRSMTFVTATATDRFTFRIGGLASGSYVVRAQADAGGNGAVNDAGDYDGYYDGTAAGPILLRADAKLVTLAAACVDNLAFGAGVKP